MNKKGFTIIEVIVAIAILVLASVVIIPSMVFGYLNLFESDKYTQDTYEVQQLVELEIEEKRGEPISEGEDGSFTVDVFDKTITGHEVEFAVPTLGTASGYFSVFIPNYEIEWTVPEIDQDTLSLTVYRDGSSVSPTDNMYPLAYMLDDSANLPTIEATEPTIEGEDFLLNVYRWYMSPVTYTEPESFSDLIIVKEWNAARTELSYEDALENDFIPNVEDDYDVLDFAEMLDYLELSDEELIDAVNERYTGRYFYYSVTPYSSIGRIGEEVYSDEVIFFDGIASIEDVYEEDIIGVGNTYVPSDNFPTVEALMVSGAYRDVEVTWNPDPIYIDSADVWTVEGSVIGYDETVYLYITSEVVPVDEVVMDTESPYTFYLGSDPVQLTAHVLPIYATNKTLNWSIVGETNLISLTEDGLATVNAFGYTGHVTVRATSDDDSSLYADCTIYVEPISLSFVSVFGNGQVGTELEANVGPDGATVTYQWLYADEIDVPIDEFEVIDGENSSTWIPTSDYAGKYVMVTVEGFGIYDGELSSTPLLIELASQDTGWISASGNNNNNGVNRPDRAYNDSYNSYATYSDDGEYVDFTFGDIVPSTATIESIQIRIRAREVTETGTKYLEVTLSNGVTTSSTLNTGSDLSTDFTDYTLSGSPDSLWGLDWNDGKINNLEVRVESYSSNDRDIYLDEIDIRVIYH